MAIQVIHQNVEIRIFTDQKQIHLTRLNREPLSLTKINSIRNKINKDVTKIASEYEVHLFSAV